MTMTLCRAYRTWHCLASKAIKKRRERVRRAIADEATRCAHLLSTIAASYDDDIVDPRELFVVSRVPQHNALRWCIWKTMRDLGYTIQEIAEANNRNHSTISIRLSQDPPKGYSQVLQHMKRATKELPHV